MVLNTKDYVKIVDPQQGVYVKSIPFTSKEGKKSNFFFFNNNRGCLVSKKRSDVIDYFTKELKYEVVSLEEDKKNNFKKEEKKMGVKE